MQIWMHATKHTQISIQLCKYKSYNKILVRATQLGREVVDTSSACLTGHVKPNPTMSNWTCPRTTHAHAPTSAYYWIQFPAYSSPSIAPSTSSTPLPNAPPELSFSVPTSASSLAHLPSSTRPPSPLCCSLRLPFKRYVSFSFCAVARKSTVVACRLCSAVVCAWMLLCGYCMVVPVRDTTWDRESMLT